MKYILSIITLAIISYYYKLYIDRITKAEDYGLVSKYYLNKEMIEKSKKPIIWIHMSYDKNSRVWESFGSRMSNKLNKPYIYLTLKSIIEKCGKNFDICIVNDKSFIELVEMDIENVASPIKEKLRDLAMCKLLCKYGGLIVPNTLYCIKDLSQMYYSVLSCNNMLYCDTYPIRKVFIGANKNRKEIKDYTKYLEKTISSDMTDESNFLDTSNRWLVKNMKVEKIPPMMLGIKDANGKRITIDRLLGKTQIDFDRNLIGILIPDKEINRRTNYQWFATQSINQIYNGDTELAKILKN